MKLICLQTIAACCWFEGLSLQLKKRKKSKEEEEGEAKMSVINHTMRSPLFLHNTVAQEGEGER